MGGAVADVAAQERSDRSRRAPRTSGAALPARRGRALAPATARRPVLGESVQGQRVEQPGLGACRQGRPMARVQVIQVRGERRARRLRLAVQQIQPGQRVGDGQRAPRRAAREQRAAGLGLPGRRVQERLPGRSGARAIGAGSGQSPSCSRVACRRSSAPACSPRSLNSCARLRTWTASERPLARARAPPRSPGR